MLEELIEKIKSLLLQDTNQMRHSYNMGVNDSIGIIKTFIPQPQDKPDSEGWWWRKESGGKLMPFFIEAMGNPISPKKRCLIIRSDKGITLVSELSGEWYKAIHARGGAIC